jgi:hypothetical protein
MAAAKRRRYQLSLIRQDYTYTVQQIADLFGLCNHTVLEWVKTGLKPIPQTRPYLIHSAMLYDFLATRQARRKQACQPHEIFCLKCRQPRSPAQGTLTTQPTKNDFIRLMGQCACCGTRMNKIIKPADWHANHPLQAYLQPSVKQHNVAQQTQPKPSVEQGGQLWLNLTH